MSETGEAHSSLLTFSQMESQQRGEPATRWQERARAADARVTHIRTLYKGEWFPLRLSPLHLSLITETFSSKGVLHDPSFTSTSCSFSAPAPSPLLPAARDLSHPQKHRSRRRLS